MRRKTHYVTVTLTYYEANTYWMAAAATLHTQERAEFVLGKGVRGLSPVAAARRAHAKLEKALIKVQETGDA